MRGFVTWLDRKKADIAFVAAWIAVTLLAAWGLWEMFPETGVVGAAPLVPAGMMLFWVKIRGL